MTNYNMDQPPIKPYGIRSKYTSYLTIVNKLGLLILGILVLSGMTTCSTMFSIASSEQVLIRQMESEMDTTNLEQIKKATNTITSQLKRAMIYGKLSIMIGFGSSLILTPIVLINLRCAKKLREFLLFAGEDEKGFRP